MATIKIRRGTSEQAVANNPVLESGEPGYELDTKVFKIGDGVTPWNELPAVGGSLENLNDVSLMSAPMNKQMLAYDTDMEAWTPQSPEQLDIHLDQLQDVDTYTTAPEDGNVLVWDAAMGLWRPGTGVPKVGSWENDQIVTFSAGTPQVVENAAIPVAGQVMPATPQVTITVTEAMLAQSSRPSVGFGSMLTCVFLFDSTAMTGATSGSLTGEMTFLGELIGTTASINTTTNGRSAMTFTVRDVKVGDVVSFKFRLGSSTHAGVNLVAHSATCFPQQILREMPENGGVYMYQQLISETVLPVVAFSSYPTAATLVSWRCYDDNVAASITNTAPEAERPRWIGRAPFGIYNTYSFVSPTSRLGAESRTAGSTVAWNVAHLRAPSRIQFDRIALPPMPA